MYYSLHILVVSMLHWFDLIHASREFEAGRVHRGTLPSPVEEIFQFVGELQWGR